MLLDAAGVPVPLGRSVTSAEAAWEAAQELGGPVVVKPRDGSQSRGVAVNIETRERVIQAFEVAEEISSEVIVERYIPGHDFRLLVVGGNLVAASRRDPPLESPATAATPSASWSSRSTPTRCAATATPPR